MCFSWIIPKAVVGPPGWLSSMRWHWQHHIFPGSLLLLKPQLVHLSSQLFIPTENGGWFNLQFRKLCNLDIFIRRQMRSVYSPSYEGNSGAQLSCSSADFLLNRLLYKSWGNFFPGFVLGWCQCFWSLLALTWGFQGLIY